MSVSDESKKCWFWSGCVHVMFSCVLNILITNVTLAPIEAFRAIIIRNSMFISLRRYLDSLRILFFFFKAEIIFHRKNIYNLHFVLTVNYWPLSVYSHFAVVQLLFRNGFEYVGWCLVRSRRYRDDCYFFLVSIHRSVCNDIEQQHTHKKICLDQFRWCSCGQFSRPDASYAIANKFGIFVKD